MTTKPQAILFDLDNTLTNRQASITVFAQQFFNDFLNRHNMSQVDDIMPIIHDADGGGYRPLDARWRMLQDHVLWIDTPSIDELRDYWYTHLGQCAIGVGDLHETLSVLRERAIRLGIITNGPTGLQNATTDTLNIRQYMDCVVVSETVGIEKPDARIYEVALNTINQSVKDVWFVGDNPATDLLGGYRLGMTTVWIQGHHEWNDESFQADYIVDNISEILPLF